MLVIFIFILSLVASVYIVNKAYQIYMKVIGASAMFYSGKKKLIAIVVVALLLASLITQIFGIPIPKY